MDAPRASAQAVIFWVRAVLGLALESDAPTTHTEPGRKKVSRSIRRSATGSPITSRPLPGVDDAAAEVAAATDRLVTTPLRDDAAWPVGGLVAVLAEPVGPVLFAVRARVTPLRSPRPPPELTAMSSFRVRCPAYGQAGRHCSAAGRGTDGRPPDPELSGRSAPVTVSDNRVSVDP